MSETSQAGKKKAFQKKDLILIGVILLLCAGMFFWMYAKRDQGTGENYAVVTVDGYEVLRYDLGLYHDKTEVVDLREFGVPASLELKDGAIRFIDVTCPDHLCEKMGYQKNEMDMAVCLPNRTAVMIYTPEEIRNMEK